MTSLSKYPELKQAHRIFILRNADKTNIRYRQVSRFLRSFQAQSQKKENFANILEVLRSVLNFG